MTSKAVAKKVGLGAAILCAVGLVAKIALEIAFGILGAIYPAPAYFCRMDCTPLSRLWWMDRDINVTTSILVLAPISILVAGVAIVTAILLVRIYKSVGQGRT